MERDYPKIKFQLYDANAHRIDDVQTGDLSGLVEVLESDDYDAVAIGGLITAYKYIKQAVKLVRRDTDAAIIAGGGFLSAIPEDMMRLLPEIDIGIIGEAYQTVPELLETLENNSPVEDVKGVIYRNGIKCLQRSPPRPLIPDLDWLPYPAYDYAPLDIYFKNSSILMSKESMNAKRRLDVCFSLGCPFQCKYCWDLAITSNTVHNGRPAKHTLHRHHSPKYVADLIKYLLDKYQVDFFSWLDENIVAHDAQTGFTWLKEIAEELEKRYLLPEQREQGGITKPIYHGGTSHPGLVKRDTLKTMKRIGFTYLDYGLESFDPAILKGLGKGSTPQRNIEAVAMTLEEGIEPIPNQIIGFPDETWDSINRMLDAWEQTGIISKPFLATPYPGSEWFETYRKDILQQYNGSLEDYLLDLGDATSASALLTKKFTAAELIGIQNILADAARSGNFTRARRLLRLSSAQQSQ